MDRLAPDVRISRVKRLLEPIAGHGASEGRDGMSPG